MNNQKGFTLIELMIAIGVIGVLAAITIPNFKKYQAKSKIVEAKIQLAGAFTAEMNFFQMFNMYSNCLDYMGYNPEKQKDGRFFAVGFPAVTANLDAGYYNAALGEWLVEEECPRDLGEQSGKSVFLAGKGMGMAVVATLADFSAFATITSPNLNESVGPKSTEVHAGIGIQNTKETKAFTITAAGYISSEHLTPDTASLWTINQDKVFTNFQNGY